MSTDTTPPDRPGTARPALLGIAVAVTLLVVALAIMVGRRQLDRKAEADRSTRAETLESEAAARGALFVPRVARDLVPVDPTDPAWNAVPSIEGPLNRQVDTMPILAEATVSTAEIRGISDGEWIVWRLAWADETPDLNVDTGRFTDAAALQFPVDRGAAHTMGDDRHSVQILHWKALWQRDIDEHFQDVQDLHPNYWTDLYWFADGPAPNRVPDDFSDPRSHQYFAAYSAGNPMADFHRTRPVEELSATGFGSLTSQTESVTDGRGVWREGRWYVSFVRPMRTDDPLDYQFWRGGPGSLNIAVWNGSAGNVGGRKHWSNWIDFEVSP